MKLASYKDGSRDGQLVVVSRDLSQAHYASHIANRLQQVLDDWNYLSPPLQDISDALNAGRARHAFAFDPAQCLAPLPRAYQVLTAEVYPAVPVTPQAPAAAAAAQITHGAGDALWGAREPLRCAPEAMGLDFGAGVAVITGDIAQGTTAENTLEGVRLVALGNAVTLRALPHGATAECQVGIGFSPVAVTPDELGAAWSRGRLNLPLQTSWNGRKVGIGDAGAEMGLHFGQLLAQLARIRPLRAGSILLAGPLSQAGVEQQGQWSWPAGYHCIADKRAMEVRQDGQARTEYLRLGDSVAMDMKNAAGQSVFGAIEQQVS